MREPGQIIEPNHEHALPSRMSINEEIRSRVTYSVVLPSLSP